MDHSFIERLERRALMSATVVHEVYEFEFSGPAYIFEGAEVMDLTVAGSDAVTQVTTRKRTHGVFREEFAAAGPGLETGTQYELTGRVVGVDSFSLGTGTGVAHAVGHLELTTPDGRTVRQVQVTHFQVLRDGRERFSVKVV